MTPPPSPSTSVVIDERFIVAARRVPVRFVEPKGGPAFSPYYGVEVQRIREVAPKIVIAPYVGPIMAVVLSVTEDVLDVRVEMKAPDARRGEDPLAPWIDVVGNMGQLSLEAFRDACSMGNGDEVLADVIARAMLAALDHEIREAVLVRGKRVLDPHGGRNDG